jgi:uncharacterized flavoprotein (TIGR03862 family)
VPRGIDVAVIGGGPAGLMAAEAAAVAGANVTVFDAMASVGRKILIAGKGGLNLTHSEPWPDFLSRYGAQAERLTPHLNAFSATDLRSWAATLGIETAVGSSGRVFPADYKAAPLLRRWLHRLREQGVRFATRHRWHGWNPQGALSFQHDETSRDVMASATVLALGGASWPRLGSDGAWREILLARGIRVTPFQPANCGFEQVWSAHLLAHFSGQPVKSIAVVVRDSTGKEHRAPGEFVVTDYGVEGGPFYRFSAIVRDELALHGRVDVTLDLAPGRTEQALLRELGKPRGKRSLSEYLRRKVRLQGIKVALLRDLLPRESFDDPETLARFIKALPLKLTAARPLAEAISTAGGVSFDVLDETLALREHPDVFCAGEMVDWEAPTGGYLLTACLAMGRAAGMAAALHAKSRGHCR